MSFKHVNVIEVRLWGKMVGALAEIAPNKYGFRYDQKRWLKEGLSISPLYLPLGTQLFDDSGLSRDTYFGLPATFADSLPDRFGNQLIDEYMRSKGVISQSEITPLDRLAYVGTRAIGVLEYYEPLIENRSSEILELNELISAARDAITGRLDNPLASRQAIESLIDIGTSAGGAKAKAVIAYNQTTQEVRSGHATNLSQGFEHYIIKFDGVSSSDRSEREKNAGRVEYAYYLMAKEAGIDISPSKLIEENGRAHFLTQRFDRAGAHKRHHIQTACALGHFDYKQITGYSYEQMFGLLQQLEMPIQNFEQLFLRMTFNILSANCDDHTKNISFMLKEGEQKWILAPAYDLTFAYNPKGKWTKQHYLSVNGARLNIKYKDIMSVADSYSVPDAKTLYKQVAAVVAEWPKFAKQAGVEKARMKAIQEVMLEQIE